MQRTIINRATEKLFDAIIKNESIDAINELLKDKEVALTALDDDSTPIQLAARKSRWDVVQAIIVKCKKVNNEDNERFGSALRYAVVENNDDIVKELLKAKASFRWFSSKNGNRVLHSAAKNNNPKMIKLLRNYLDPVRDYYLENDKKEIPLEIALNNSYWGCAKVFLEDKNFTFKNKTNRNEKKEGRAFIRAVGDGQLELANALLAAGVNNNFVRANGDNVLHHVVKQWNRLKNYKQMETLDYALKHGGDQTAVNNEGKTPIELASELKHWDCVKLLLENSNHDAKSLHLNTILINAIKDHHYQMTELLLERGADCNVIGENGNMALYWAIKENQPKLFTLLLEHKANPKLKDKWGYNTIALARDSLNPLFLNYLNYKQYTISEKDMTVDNLVEILSNRLFSFNNTRPPKYKRTVEQYINEANICITALNVNGIRYNDLSIIIKHSVLCVKEVVNHYSKTLLKKSSDNIFKNVSKEIELLKTINNVLNYTNTLNKTQLETQVEKCLKEQYQTQLEKQLSIYLIHITKIADYRLRLKNYPKDFSQAICEERTWLVKNKNLFTKLFFNIEWVPGIPDHIDLIKDKLKILSLDDSLYSLLKVYGEILKELLAIKPNYYRHPNTAQTYQDIIYDMRMLLTFNPQEPESELGLKLISKKPIAESQIAESQIAEKQMQMIEDQITEKQMRMYGGQITEKQMKTIEGESQNLVKPTIKKKIISPLPFRNSNNSISPYLTNPLENTNKLLRYTYGTEFKRANSEMEGMPADPKETNFAGMFPPVVTDTLPRVYKTAPHAPLYPSPRLKREDQATPVEHHLIAFAQKG